WAYYGLRFPNGEFNIDASITGTKSVDKQIGADETAQININKIKSSGYRGHIFSSGKYEINDIWRSSFDIKLASDNFYLKRFAFFDKVDRTLESSIKLEGFDGDNYTLVKTAMFRGETCETAPKILPTIERNYSHDFLNGTFSLDSVFMNLDFCHGRSARKFVSSPSWNKKIMLPFGHILEIAGTVSLRALNVSEKQHSEYDSSFNVTSQIKCMWEWPLLFYNSAMSTIFTPIAGAVIASNRKYSDIFEDQFNDLNDINLFEGNRSTSSYNIDTGKRVFYGARIAGYNGASQIYRLITGQSYDLTSVSEDKAEASGLKYKRSNVVSSLDIFLTDELTLSSYGSYSPKNKDWTKFEAGLKFTHKGFSADIFGFNGRQCFYDPFKVLPSALTEEQKTQKYKGIMFDCGWQATHALKLKNGITFGNKCEDLNTKINNADFKLVKYNVGFEYKNECTSVEVVLERTNYKSGDLKPETSFRFVLHLKNLGI
ncbi:MAG: LPS-assembly protein LptD, partial [Alphaproteobacteria bacterium]|nr:LPS-assembly protein LptD [Alphaproteobacteria bacterium]